GGLVSGSKARGRVSVKVATIVASVALVLAASMSIAFMQDGTLEADTAWVCPMHSDYTTEAAGKCPRCGMDLVHAAPFDVRDYRLDLRTVPAVVKPGQPATLFFKIHHPGTGEQMKKFEVVHERPYHLFVISQDMAYFQHFHPEE